MVKIRQKMVNVVFECPLRCLIVKISLISRICVIILTLHFCAVEHTIKLNLAAAQRPAAGTVIPFLS